METKKCSRCGQEKPFADFYAAKRNKDGLQSYCKECQKQLGKENRQKKTVQSIVSGDSLLAGYTSRELIAELRRRGYRGELRFENIIKL